MKSNAVLLKELNYRKREKKKIGFRSEFEVKHSLPKYATLGRKIYFPKAREPLNTIMSPG